MVTLDGYFEGPNKEIDWHVVDSEFNDFADTQLKSVDTILFGRVTYQLMANYWPTPSAITDDPIIAREAVADAYSLDPDSWRTGIEMAKLQVRENHLSDALVTARKNYKNNKDNCVVGLHFANILSLNKKYDETLKTLNQLVMLPAESDKWSGDIDSHSLFRETNILCAINQMKAGKWGKALTYLKDAETWPQNLGWGEPYFPDNRLTKFLSAYCYNKLNDKGNSDKSFTYITTYSNPDGWTSPLENQLSAMVKAGSRDFKKISETLTAEQDKNREIELLKSFQAIL
jgi:dihydrofolate reductase